MSLRQLTKGLVKENKELDEIYNNFIVDKNPPAPYIIQHFKSLEGEGGDNAVGLTTLFLRLNKCNLSCNFCDTAFSIKGDERYNIVRADTELTELLNEKYSEEDRKYIHSCSITGGEPLIHLESFEDIIEELLESFTGINHIIVETNGLYLYKRENALKFLELANIYANKIKFTLSISPKLDAKVSYGKAGRTGDVNNRNILYLYEGVFKNYKRYLSSIVNVQCKFVHSPELKATNEPLMDIILANELIEPRTKILIMPFTPPLKSSTYEIDWKNSKDAAARYAFEKYLRYSPRIHVDRNMD